MRASAPLLLVAVLLPACRVSESVQTSARDVLTLRNGTIHELRERRGQGPFVRYEVAPEAMLDVLAAAAGRARDLAGRPVTGIAVSKRYGHVVAKERAPDAPKDPGYSEDWRTAVVAIVHAVPGEPRASRVEIHGTRRSPLLGGANDWERALPAWIEQELAARGLPPGRPLP